MATLSASEDEDKVDVRRSILSPHTRHRGNGSNQNKRGEVTEIRYIVPPLVPRSVGPAVWRSISQSIPIELESVKSCCGRMIVRWGSGGGVFTPTLFTKITTIV